MSNIRLPAGGHERRSLDAPRYDLSRAHVIYLSSGEEFVVSFDFDATFVVGGPVPIGFAVGHDDIGSGLRFPLASGQYVTQHAEAHEPIAVRAADADAEGEAWVVPFARDDR